MRTLKNTKFTEILTAEQAEITENKYPLISLISLWLIFFALFPVHSYALDWTVMVYMCGDNSMNDQSYVDLAEMMSASGGGSSEQVKIIVQIDNIASSVEPGCRRYLIENGQKALLADLGVIDMAAPQTLIDFARFTTNHFSAQKYLLILWDHGNGWPVGNYGDNDEKGIIYDQSSNNWMGVAGGELQYAITEIKKILRKKLSIVGFDACLMGMVEVASEITPGAEIMFASEEVTPWNGLPYNNLLSVLISEPTLSPQAFAQKMVEVTVTSYNHGSQGYEPCTYSAIDLKKLSKTQNEFSNCYRILSRYANTSLMREARNGVQTFSIEHNPPTPNDDYIDLIDFLERTQNAITNPNDKSTLTKTINSLRNSVLAKGTVGSYLVNANGISIWFPDNYIFFKKQISDYQSLAWGKQVHWLSFLNDYYGLDDVKPTSVQIVSSNVGGSNDFHLFWNRSVDLAPVRYDLIETKAFNLTFSDYCDSMNHWNNNGFTLSPQNFYSTPTSFFSGAENNLNNKLTLTEPLQAKSGGLLSFWSYYSTEESYLLTGTIKRDIFYVEKSVDGHNYSAIDSFYGKSKIWTEHRYILPKSDSLWLRFRYVTDATISDLGVFLDDIKLFTFSDPRLIASQQADTSFYIFNIPQGNYYYLVVPIDSFGNTGFASSAKQIILQNYSAPFSLPSPFKQDCKIYCDFPCNERPDLYIYTLSGELIKKIDYTTFRKDTAYWDGKNTYGKEVAADIYIILLKSDKFIRLGKIAKEK